MSSIDGKPPPQDAVRAEPRVVAAEDPVDDREWSRAGTMPAATPAAGPVPLAASSWLLTNAELTSQRC